MTSTNPWPRDFFLLDSLGRKNQRDDAGKTRRGRKLGHSLFGPFALILNVCANENYLCDSETLLVVASVNKAFACLKSVFFTSETSAVVDSSLDARQFRIDLEYAPESSTIVDEIRSSYKSFVSRYLQDCQRMNENSLCKKMSRVTSMEQRIFFVHRVSRSGERAIVENHRGDLVNVACMLMKLKRYLNQQSERAILNPKVCIACKNPKPPLAITRNQSTATCSSSARTYCDKGVQCSKNTEFLKVSPELKFFSRSSLVINVDEEHRHQQQRQLQRENSSTPSLEYVANYRPEFRRRRSFGDGPAPNLRSFSSSAIFGLLRGRKDARLRCGNERLTNASSEKYNWFTCPNKSRPRRRVRASTERLKDTIKRTENEFLRYSNFVEDDLTSLHCRGAAKPKSTGSRQKSRFRRVNDEDMLAVRKILLEDYITEVKEIVRSESRKLEEEREAKILESVKQRMDEDLVSSSPGEPTHSRQSLGSDSWHSMLMPGKLSPCKSGTSYVTARESLSSDSVRCCCYCRCGGERMYYRESSRELFKLRGQKSCCLAEDGGKDDRRCASLMTLCDSCRPRTRNKCSEVEVETLKTCASCMENKPLSFCKQRGDLETSSTAKSSHSVDSGVLVDFPSRASGGDWASSDDNFSTGHPPGDHRLRRRRRSPEQASAECSSGRSSGTKAKSCCSSSTSSSNNDETLCQRVESAVRKFTEKLILCERRARDRSRSMRRRQRQRRKSRTSLTNQSVCSAKSGRNYPINSRCSSDDDEQRLSQQIACISTPSLVSLSDSEFPSSPRMPTTTSTTTTPR